MDTVIGITTAPRKVPRIGETLASLSLVNKQKWLCSVFAEPGSPTPENAYKNQKIEWYLNFVTRGCFRNWYSAAEHCMLRKTERVLLLQDDIVFAPEAFDALEKIWPHTAGVVSLYTNLAMSPTQTQHGWGHANYSASRGYWGALALCVKRDLLRDLLQTDPLRYPAMAHKPGIEKTAFRKVDVLFGRACLQLGIPIYTPVYSLVDHIGAESTIGRDNIPGIQRGRRGVNFGKPLPD